MEKKIGVRNECANRNQSQNANRRINPSALKFQALLATTKRHQRAFSPKTKHPKDCDTSPPDFWNRKLTRRIIDERGVADHFVGGACHDAG
jgi:hypothetical protein